MEGITLGIINLGQNPILFALPITNPFIQTNQMGGIHQIRTLKFRLVWPNLSQIQSQVPMSTLETNLRGLKST